MFLVWASYVTCEVWGFGTWLDHPLNKSFSPVCRVWLSSARAWQSALRCRMKDSLQNVLVELFHARVDSVGFVFGPSWSHDQCFVEQKVRPACDDWECLSKLDLVEKQRRPSLAGSNVSNRLFFVTLNNSINSARCRHEWKTFHLSWAITLVGFLYHTVRWLSWSRCKLLNRNRFFSHELIHWGRNYKINSSSSCVRVNFFNDLKVVV